MATIRLTAAQAMARYLSVQMTEKKQPFFAGIWAIFGHGNVAGFGEALYQTRAQLPVLRGHNEQSMAHAAIAYAKAYNRQRAMAVTTSIGPGATNMVTAAALAHVNRLPVLLIPGDVFANRRPDPVLQQVEDFSDATISANDCFKPVSRYFDRISRPEQILTALPRALRCLTDPVDCGPVTLAFCQDVQAEAYDWPEAFLRPKIWYQRRPPPDQHQLTQIVDLLSQAKKPLLIAGGGVHYADACQTLQIFVEKHQIPVAETQAGKSALPWDHPLNLGSIGVTGASSANQVAAEADLILAVGTRLQDFITASCSLFKHPEVKFASLNINAYDGGKHQAQPLIADVKVGLTKVSHQLGDLQYVPPDPALKESWLAAVEAVTALSSIDQKALPTDAQVIGAVQRATDETAIIVCAAGGLPGELHKLWKNIFTQWLSCRIWFFLYGL